VGDIQTDRQTSDLISLLSFLESKIKKYCKFIRLHGDAASNAVTDNYR
jgi:hypothetical protein